MLAITELHQYLNKYPWAKVKDISRSLGLSRKATSKLLHYNSETFQKNELNRWSLCDENDMGALLDAAKILPPPITEKNSIIVDNIDLVERIKGLLKASSDLKASIIADRLEANRRLVSRTLHSFKDVFAKTASNQWFIRSDYLDNSTGVDAEFSDVIGTATKTSILPVLSYVETALSPQQAVIEARLDRNFLILAAPGTGKTHTLIERLVYTISKASGEVEPGELLVLSFSRAAVAEIRERISRAIADGAPSSLRYVQVKTFDAYATWLLNDGDYDIAGKSYDQRIKLLTAKLAALQLEQVTQRISRSRYLFVDEIQDIVGPRADMVFELVKRILARKGSVTLLGDPNQSIHDWSREEGKQTEAAEFLEKTRNHLSDRLEQFELKESHRYETPEMKQLAAKAKLILDNSGFAPKDKFAALKELIPDISLEKLIEGFNTKSVDALLCRTNAEVFQWRNWHKEKGNACIVNAGADGRPWPAWIGEAVMYYQSEVLAYENFVSRIFSNTAPLTSPSLGDIEELLNNEGLLRHGLINLNDLAFRLQYPCPAKKGDSAEKGLILSTIHKAKGLEYKNVVTMTSNKKNISEEDVRVLYVAVTRAKRSISLMQKKQAPFLAQYMKKGRGGHFRYAVNGTKFNQILGLEDFDLDTLFVLENEGIDQESLDKYLALRRESSKYVIKPVSRITEFNLNYALFMISENDSVKICGVSKLLQKDINAMSLKKENNTWVAAYGDKGAVMDLGFIDNYQTIVHPRQSPILARHIGPAGIMVFPSIQGFYPLSRATGE